MQSFVGAIRRGVRANAKVSDLNPFSACLGSYSGSVSDISRLGSSSTDPAVFENGFQGSIGSLRRLSFSVPSMAAEINSSSQVSGRRIPPLSVLHNKFGANAPQCVVPLSSIPQRWVTTSANPEETQSQVSSSADLPLTPRIKFKRLDKTAGHIMKILDKEAVESVRAQREIPDIKPGYIIQMRVEFPENKRRVSTVKGIVIARRNAGLNTTFRLRRLVAGVGVESLFPLYSPNIKEIKVIDKKKVRRAKLYYLREKMNPLKK